MMGNYKFKFSNMLPNAWFYKLKYITPAKTRNLNSMHKYSFNNKKFHPKTKSTTSFTPTAAIAPPEHSRQSYHFERELNNVLPTHHFSMAPRRSTKRRCSTKKTRVSLVIGSSASNELVLSKPVLTPEKCPSYSPDSSSFDDSGFSDLDSEFERQKVDSRFKYRGKDNNPILKKEFDLVSQFELKPIIANKIHKGRDYDIGAATKFERNKEESSCHVRKTIVNSAGGGVKLRTTSPRIGTKRVGQVHGRKSVSSEMKNVIVVKDSLDPDTDILVSMVEMILENNIRTLKDLEILLVCYLSLNSGAHQNLIINLFKQIWFEITDI